MKIIKRLIKKSEIYKGIKDYRYNYVEIFKNPSINEFNTAAKSNEYHAVRLEISKNGDVYCWNGDVSHKAVELNKGLHALYDGGDFIIYTTRKDLPEDIQQYISNSISKLTSLGCTDNTLEINYSDYDGFNFPEYSKWKTLNDIVNWKF